MKSRNFLHSSIVLSVGFACWDTRELRAGSKPPSTALARKRNTPHTSWINFFPALLRAGESSSSCEYFFLCSVIWLDVGIWLVLLLCGGGVLEAGEGFVDVPRHGEVDFSSGIVPFDGETAVSLPFPVA